MHSLYTEQNLADLKKQIRKRMILLFIFLAAALVLTVATLLMDDHRENRPEIITTLVVVLSGCAVIFIYDLLIHPLRAYSRHIDTSLHGRSHEVTVIFDHISAEDSVVDGVAYRDLIFLGDPDKHGIRERMFYWDLELPLPDFTQGQEITLRYYDRFITAYQV